jgi:hypothetical protein
MTEWITYAAAAVAGIAATPAVVLLGWEAITRMRMTPAERAALAEKRQRVRVAARQRHPRRWL